MFMKPVLYHSWSPFIILLVSATFYILAYNWPKIFWPLILIAIALLFYIVEKTSSAKEAFWRGMLFGIIVMGGVLFWFLEAYPLSWAGITDPIWGVSVVILVWLFSSIILGIFFGFWAFLLRKISFGDWCDAFLAPSLWVLLEFVRSYFFSIIWAGPNSLIGPYWTFGFLGYPLAWSRFFIALAPWGGVYFLGFVGVFVGYLIFRLYKHSLVKKNWKLFLLPMLILVLLIAINSMFTERNFSRNGDFLGVAVVNTNFKATEFDEEGLASASERTIVLKRLLNEASKQKPDMVIFPEDSRVLDHVGRENIEIALKEADKKIVIIDSVIMAKDAETKSRLMSITLGESDTSFYEKRFLMPHGEYLPYIDIWVAKMLGQNKWLENFKAFRSYEAGTEIRPYVDAGYSMGALFCSEIIPESFYRKLALSGAQFFVNVASHADFHGSDILYNQTLSLAKMKSASNGRFFVESGNFVPSFVVDDKGRIIYESIRGENNAVVIEVGLRVDKTKYTNWGDWILIVSGLVLLAPVLKGRNELC